MTPTDAASMPARGQSDPRRPSAAELARVREQLRQSAQYIMRGSGHGVPADKDVFALAMIRKLMMVRDLPRRCREPMCRRTKLCVGPTIRCDRDFPSPPVSEEEGNRRLALFQRELKKRIAERDATDAGARATAPRSR
jgi:hypothetical protein